MGSEDHWVGYDFVLGKTVLRSQEKVIETVNIVFFYCIFFFICFLLMQIAVHFFLDKNNFLCVEWIHFSRRKFMEAFGRYSPYNFSVGLFFLYIGLKKTRVIARRKEKSSGYLPYGNLKNRVNGNWKKPFGFFLTTKLAAQWKNEEIE